MSQKFPALHVNVDHIATVRQARQTFEPDPVYGAMQAEQAGADGITVHLREDRRHIQDRDVDLMADVVQTRLNLEMAATEEMKEIALDVLPDIVTLVPESREEVTTEGGLEVAGQMDKLRSIIEPLQAAGIRISLFVDPVEEQLKASADLGVDDVELHTGEYANAEDEDAADNELLRLHEGAELAHELGLGVNAGHGLTYYNIGPIANLPHLQELNIGHSIIARSMFIGLQEAIREMKQLIRNAVEG